MEADFFFLFLYLFLTELIRLIALGASIGSTTFLTSHKPHIWVTISGSQQKHQHRGTDIPLYKLPTQPYYVRTSFFEIFFCISLNIFWPWLPGSYSSHLFSQATANQIHSPFSSSISTNYINLSFIYLHDLFYYN